MYMMYGPCWLLGLICVCMLHVYTYVYMQPVGMRFTKQGEHHETQEALTLMIKYKQRENKISEVIRRRARRTYDTSSRNSSNEARNTDHEATRSNEELKR